MTIALNPIASAAPFIALFGVSLLIVAAVLLKYPSIKVYRRKRNILIYAAIAIVLGLIAYQASYIAVGPDYIAFSSQSAQTPIHSGQQNQFSITCDCDGIRGASFYMVVAGANVTLQTNSQPGYVQLNDTAIKIPFSFHGSGEQTKPVYFTAAANVSGISFYPSIVFIDNSPVMTENGLSEIHCTYDSATSSFVMADSFPTFVP